MQTQSTEEISLTLSTVHYINTHTHIPAEQWECGTSVNQTAKLKAQMHHINDRLDATEDESSQTEINCRQTVTNKI